MVLDWAGRAVGWRSDKDGRVRRRRVVGVEEHGGVPFGESAFKADDPCEAGCLGDEEGDEDYVFHIGDWWVLLLINPGGDLGVDHLVTGDLGAVALYDLVRDVCTVFFEPFGVRFLAFNRG